MSNSQSSDNAVRVLARDPSAGSVRELDLSRNFFSISNSSLEALAYSQHLQSLQMLNLQDTNVDDVGMACLFKSPNSARLRVLGLYGNYLVTSQTLQSLAASSQLRELEQLDLRAT